MFYKIAGAIFIGWTSFILGGCINTTNQGGSYNDSCKNMQVPKWIDDEFVGISRITASSNKTEQKQIAFQRAISLLLMTKGTSQGNSLISVQRELNTSNKKELYSKSFKENSSLKIKFKEINYDVKITNLWQDACTKEIYIKIKEK